MFSVVLMKNNNRLNTMSTQFSIEMLLCASGNVEEFQQFVASCNGKMEYGAISDNLMLKFKKKTLKKLLSIKPPVCNETDDPSHSKVTTRTQKLW